ncbi:GNAT family N-acetyltransferase [Algihabitans albus]|uniref:GNAT family N-acetyltransferase n=1 Tax=Algihabitans albus TaxID=2164067 RepID=UPI000E5D7002|nr:GNAT family N-acetyltransferase [Algihabitans albus]
MSQAIGIVPLTETLLAGCLTLNNAAEPHVPSVEDVRFRHLLELSHLAVAAQRGSDPLGFLIALKAGAAHDSPYYGWFQDRYREFVYVDRIVVSPAARGLGVGRKLYAAVEALTPRPPRIFCEVNEIPPNPVSLAFHKAIGFVELAKVDSGPDKRVVMLEKSLR